MNKYIIEIKGNDEFLYEKEIEVKSFHIAYLNSLRIKNELQKTTIEQLETIKIEKKSNKINS